MAEHNTAHYAEMDLRRTGAARLNQTQRRTEGLMRMSSDFDTIEKIDPFTQMETNPKGTRVHRCVEKVKRKGGGNAYAICQKSTGQSYKTGKKL
jgi:hypothetical protein